MYSLQKSVLLKTSGIEAKAVIDSVIIGEESIFFYHYTFTIGDSMNVEGKTYFGMDKHTRSINDTVDILYLENDTTTNQPNCFTELYLTPIALLIMAIIWLLAGILIRNAKTKTENGKP